MRLARQPRASDFFELARLSGVKVERVLGDLARARPRPQHDRELLADAGQIRRLRGKWPVRRVLSVDTREDRARNLELKRHWARVALERIEGAGLPTGSQYSYNLFAISDDGSSRSVRCTCSITSACGQSSQNARVRPGWRS